MLGFEFFRVPGLAVGHIDLAGLGVIDDMRFQHRKAREDMKELLTVRANVQKLMGYEAQEQEKEADRREEERS